MFCKWCGKTIQPTDRNCPACGRETPPLSDCGGLYNLKYTPGTSATPTPPPASPASAKCPIMDKLEPKYARDRKASKRHHKITMICFAVLLVAILCTAVLVIRTSSQLGQIKALVGSVMTKDPVPEATDTTPPEDTALSTETTSQEETGSPLPEDPIRPEPNSFKWDVTVQDAETFSVSATFQSDNFQESVHTGTTVSRNTQNALTASLTTDYTTMVSMELITLEEGEYPAVGIRCNSKHPLFEGMEFYYEWQYLGSDGKWATVESETLTQNDTDYTVIRYCPDWQPLLSFSSEPVKVRCKIQIQNDAGDRLDVSLDGISLSDSN